MDKPCGDKVFFCDCCHCYSGSCFLARLEIFSVFQTRRWQCFVLFDFWFSLRFGSNWLLDRSRRGNSEQAHSARGLFYSFEDGFSDNHWHQAKTMAYFILLKTSLDILQSKLLSSIKEDSRWCYCISMAVASRESAIRWLTWVRS
jgi:hypothetical protein